MNDTTTPPFALRELKVLDEERQLIDARFSPCGKFLFAGDYQGGLCRWDVESGARAVLAGHGGWVQGFEFHPDGRRLFSGDSWGQLIAWDYAEPEPTPKWKVSDCHPTWMRSLAMSPDGSTLATCGVDQFVRLWSTEAGALKHQLPRHADELFCLRFHPDGKSIVGGDLKGVVTQWDVATLGDRATLAPARQLEARALYAKPIVNGFSEINDVGGVRSLAFNSDGTLLACGGSQPATSGFFTGKPIIVLIDWVTGAATQTLQPADATPDDGIVMQLSYHPNGFFIASCSGQPGKGALWCWKPGEAAPFLYNKDLSHLRSASLHPDGKRLAVTQVRIKEGTNTGNGRNANTDEEYLGLVSRIHIFDTTPEPAATGA